jgi:hypothetical protein
MQDKSNCASYRVLIPLAAMIPEKNGSGFIAIPRGAVFVAPGTVNPFDVVEIEFEGQRLAVYNRDIEERTEKLSA